MVVKIIPEIRKEQAPSVVHSLFSAAFTRGLVGPGAEPLFTDITVKPKAE